MNISFLQNDYLNLDSRSGFGTNSERENTVQTKYTFCGGTTHFAENASKRLDRKRKNLVRLMLWTIDKRNGHLKNALDVDLKITKLQNFQSHQKNN